MRVLACDPGFAAFGYVVVNREIVGEGNGTQADRVRAMGVIRTKKEAKKRQILAVEDSFARCREIATALRRLIDEYNVQAIAFEAFSVPMKSNKSNLVKIGHPYGILAALAEDRPVVMLTPQRVRKDLVEKGASKDDVERVVAARFADDPVVRAFKSECAKSIQNHAWDALAVYLACWQSDVMRALATAGT